MPDSRSLKFAVPTLATFDMPPSWCNAHGHVDRSACIEVRQSEVRRLAGCVRDRLRVWPERNKVRLPVQPLPNEQPARNTHGRVATGTYRITAGQVEYLQRHRLPRQLAGDRRTTRANVMRDEFFKRDNGFKLRRPHNAPQEIVPFDCGLDGNPNAGASRRKIINIEDDWSQLLRIEKWIFANRIKPAYYLICPGSFRTGSGQRTGVRGSSVLCCAPPLSTCGPGRKATGCPQRTLKLLIVQCTKAEQRDANIAQSWLDAIPKHAVPCMRPEIDRLLQRYAMIMPPRQLLCARCLDVRYGNNPENARQSWRRAQGKDDARPAKRKRST